MSLDQVALDTVHLLAACLWVGAALFMALVVPRGVAPVQGKPKRDAYNAIQRRVSMLLGISFLLLLGTGLAMAGAHGTLAKNGGPLLGAKLGLAVASIAVAGKAGSKLKRLDPIVPAKVEEEAWAASRRFNRIHMVLAVAIVALAAALRWGL
ncbi:MAG: hypothetical protein HY558_05010 [Euryarchaeota archaeon]|nr:hypothetical protein [Euryarchaeota archaeon]